MKFSGDLEKFKTLPKKSDTVAGGGQSASEPDINRSGAVDEIEIKRTRKIVTAILTVAFLIVTSVFIFFIKIKYSAPQSTETKNSNNTSGTDSESGGKILARSPSKADGSPEYYWANPDGSGQTPLKLDIKIDDKTRFLEDIVVSPGRLRLLVIVGDKILMEEVNKLLLEEDTEKLKNIYDKEFKYDFYIVSLDKNTVTIPDRDKIMQKIGKYKIVLFSGWADDENVFFEAKNSMSFRSEDPEQEVVIGTYNVASGEIKSLVKTETRNLRAQFMTPDKSLLHYIKDYGFIESENILKNFVTNNEQKVDTQKYLSTEGEYWVSYSDDNYKGNLDQEGSIAISNISDLQKKSSPITLSDPRRYFVHEFNNLSWSDDYSLFALTAEYNRSGTGIEYQEPQLYVYNRSGNLKCMWNLNDSVRTESMIYPEKYTEKIFSKDNQKLLLVSKPIAEYYKTVYWRTFDLESCSLVIDKKKIDNQLNPIDWF